MFGTCYHPMAPPVFYWVVYRHVHNTKRSVSMCLEALSFLIFNTKKEVELQELYRVKYSVPNQQPIVRIVPIEVTISCLYFLAFSNVDLPFGAP